MSICYVFNLSQCILRFLVEMGAAQSIPGVGETVTAVDSGCKLVASGVCSVVGNITGDKDMKNTAGKLFSDAGQTWVEYSERNIIVAPIRASLAATAGKSEEATRVLKKMVSSVEEVADNTPVIGHAKGVVHYTLGDTEHGSKCIKGSTRSAAVLGAGALSGGLGLGVAAGGASGALGGVTYDAAVTVIENRPYGVHKAVDKAVKSCKERNSYEYVRSVMDVAYTIAGDAVGGAAAAETVKLIKAKKQKSALTEVVDGDNVNGATESNSPFPENVQEQHLGSEFQLEIYISVSISI